MSRDGKDTVSAGEEQFAKFPSGCCSLAKVIVANAKEGRLGVIGGVSDDLVELCGDIDSAIRHKMIDIIDDHESGFDELYVAFDLSGEFPIVFPERSEHVKAKQVESHVLVVEGRCHLLEERRTGMWPTDGVDPQNCGFLGHGVDRETGRMGILAIEYGCRNHFGKVVCMAGVFASNIGDVVLLNYRLIVE